MRPSPLLFDGAQLHFTFPASFAVMPTQTLLCGYSETGVPYTLQFMSADYSSLHCAGSAMHTNRLPSDMTDVRQCSLIESLVTHRVIPLGQQNNAVRIETVFDECLDRVDDFLCVEIDNSN